MANAALEQELGVWRRVLLARDLAFICEQVEVRAMFAAKEIVQATRGKPPRRARGHWDRNRQPGAKLDRRRSPGAEQAALILAWNAWLGPTTGLMTPSSAHSASSASCASRCTRSSEDYAAKRQ